MNEFRILIICFLFIMGIISCVRGREMSVEKELVERNNLKIDSIGYLLGLDQELNITDTLFKSLNEYNNDGSYRFLLIFKDSLETSILSDFDSNDVLEKRIVFKSGDTILMEIFNEWQNGVSMSIDYTNEIRDTTFIHMSKNILDEDNGDYEMFHYHVKHQNGKLDTIETVKQTFENNHLLEDLYIANGEEIKSVLYVYFKETGELKEKYIYGIKNLDYTEIFYLDDGIISSRKYIYEDITDDFTKLIKRSDTRFEVRKYQE